MPIYQKQPFFICINKGAQKISRFEMNTGSQKSKNQHFRISIHLEYVWDLYIRWCLLYICYVFSFTLCYCCSFIKISLSYIFK